MTRRLTHALAALMCFALLASSCGGSDAASDAIASDGGEGSGSATWPVLAAPLADGGQFDLGDLEGQDVILWFWAPW